MRNHSVRLSNIDITAFLTAIHTIVIVVVVVVVVVVFVFVVVLTIDPRICGCNHRQYHFFITALAAAELVAVFVVVVVTIVFVNKTRRSTMRPLATFSFFLFFTTFSFLDAFFRCWMHLQGCVLANTMLDAFFRVLVKDAGTSTM